MTTVPLDATISLDLKVRLPHNFTPLEITTPDGLLSELATVEVSGGEGEPRMLGIRFQTALGTIDLTISTMDFAAILREAQK